MCVDQIRSEGHRALRRGRASLEGQIYHVTSATRGRLPVFASPDAAWAASASFDAAASADGSCLLAWVLMPDHAHWLLQLGEGGDLSDVVSRIKACSARETNAVIQRRGVLWERAFHDRALRRDDDVAQVARYIVTNPVRAGLVSGVGHYPYWNSIYL